MKPGILIALLIPSLLWATAQEPEHLILDGKQEAMMATPLEDYFDAIHPRPASLHMTSTACWRGYVGTWEVKDGTLFLRKLERTRLEQVGKSVEEVAEEIPLAEIIPNAQAPVAASWFSGVVRISRGEMLAYVHMGFGSVYAEDLFISFVRGRVIGKRIVKNDPRDVTSEVDLGWRELGRMTKTGGAKVVYPEDARQEESGDWLDGEDFYQQRGALWNGKIEFRIRGIFFEKRLWLPPRRGWPGAEIALVVDGVRNLPAAGSAAEVTGVLRDGGTGPCLVARAVSELAPGTAIQKARKE